MAVIFDGKKFASEKLDEIRKEAEELKERGVAPKLVSIFIGDDAGSKLYLSLKQKAATRIGAEVEIKRFPKITSSDEAIKLIRQLNQKEEVHGIMIQLPLPENLKHKTYDIVGAIAEGKDVDGLREDSKFTPPTARAVMEILSLSRQNVHFKYYPVNVLVVGASGFIGRQIVRALSKWGTYKLVEADSRTKNLDELAKAADVIISATGKPDLIKKDMVEDGGILIDVGSPCGDVEKAVYEKASFVSPVPGGVGPVTIAYLMENLVEAAKEK